MNQTGVAAYATTIDEFNHIVTLGATHCILEDPRVSIRTFHESPNLDAPLLQLIDHAKQYPVSLSFNLDIIPHHQDFEMIESILILLKNKGIPHIRIQDPSLVSFIKNIMPHATITLFTETGTNSLTAISLLSKIVTAQQLSNELPYKSLRTITQPIPFSYDLMVQGPLMIQYSPRRFLQNHPENNNESQRIATAYDDQYPKRMFIFLDNEHGHFMYAYFHRCLIHFQEKLRSLNLRFWIVDTRGLSKKIRTTYISQYAQALKAPLKDPHKQVELLKKISGISQKPGFFKANKTDQDRGTQSPYNSNDYTGTIIDIIKGHSVMFETTQTIQENEQLTAITPEGRTIAIQLTGLMCPITQESLHQSRPFQLVQIPHVKGLTIKTRLFKESTK